MEWSGVEWSGVEWSDMALRRISAAYPAHIRRICGAYAAHIRRITRCQFTFIKLNEN